MVFNKDTNKMLFTVETGNDSWRFKSRDDDLPESSLIKLKLRVRRFK